MRHTIRPATYGIALILGLCLVGAPAAAQQAEGALVDYRMAPLEQAKKIFQVVQATGESNVTLTVMNELTPGEDGEHVIVSEDQATEAYLQGQLSDGSVDSVSWTPRSDKELYGSCDTQNDCESKTDQMCKKAGHGGAKANSVKISIHSDGSKTCSASCKNNGAVAFVTCNPNRG